jgi:hypothetical protein
LKKVPSTDPEPNKPTSMITGRGLAIGVSFGLMFGLLLNNLILGILFGVIIGVGVDRTLLGGGDTEVHES